MPFIQQPNIQMPSVAKHISDREGPSSERMNQNTVRDVSRCVLTVQGK